MTFPRQKLTRRQQEQQILNQEAMQQRRERFRQAGNLTSSQIDQAVRNNTNSQNRKYGNRKNAESDTFFKERRERASNLALDEEGVTKEDYLIKKHLGGLSFAKLIHQLDPTSLGHVSVNKLTKFLRSNKLNTTLLSDREISNAINRRLRIANGIPVTEASNVQDTDQLNKLTYKQLSQLLRVETDFIGEREIAKIYTQKSVSETIKEDNCNQEANELDYNKYNYEDEKIEYNDAQKLSALKYELSERMQTRYGNVQNAVKRMKQADGSISEQDLGKFLTRILPEVGSDSIEQLKQDLIKNGHAVEQKLFPDTEERICSPQLKSIKKIVSGDDLQRALDFSQQDALLFRRNEGVLADLQDKQLDANIEEQNKSVAMLQSKNLGEHDWDDNRPQVDISSVRLNKAGEEAIKNAEQYTESLNKQYERKKINYQPATTAKKNDIMTKEEYDQICKENQDKIIQLFKQVSDANKQGEKQNNMSETDQNAIQNYVSNKFNKAKMTVSNFYFTEENEWPKRPEGYKVRRAKSSFDYYQDKDYYWSEDNRQNVKNLEKQRVKDKDIQPIRYMLYSAYPKGRQSVRLAHDLIVCQQDADGDFNTFQKNLENIGAGILGKKDCQWIANQCVENPGEEGKPIKFNVNKLLDRLGLQMESESAREHLSEFKSRKSTVHKISEGNVGLPLFRLGELQSDRDKRLQGEYGVAAQKKTQREMFREEQYDQIMKTRSQSRTSSELLGALSQEPDRLPPPISAYFNEEQKRINREKFIEENKQRPPPQRTQQSNAFFGQEIHYSIKDRRSHSTYNQRLSHTRLFDQSPGGFGGLQPPVVRSGRRGITMGSQVADLIDERRWLSEQKV